MASPSDCRRASQAATTRFRPARVQIGAVKEGSGIVASYFSVIQRKVLEPNQWRSLAELEAALIAFGEQYSAIARPFECASPGSISTACWLP